MWKGITYKEWLKIKWFVLVYAGLGILGVAYIFIRVQHDITFSSSNGYWFAQLFMGVQYFKLFKFFPLAGALAVAIAQYFPETVNKRIKLTFHLPVNENKALLQIWLFGTACLMFCYLLQLVLFTALSMYFFPSNIILPALSSMVPWFLAGFICYNLTALIILEPVWRYRVFYFIIATLFIPLFLPKAETGGFSQVNIILAILTLFSSFSLLFSGYRFRKGEM